MQRRARPAQALIRHLICHLIRHLPSESEREPLIRHLPSDLRWGLGSRVFGSRVWGQGFEA
eukprot:3736499-Rhodomonas_salina.1